jgi:uncharacterized protein YdhG (YjbR/CyaY superfamily)
MRQAAPKTIDDYIVGFPANVQGKLKQIRRTIRRAAPGAEEAISYQIPTFILNGGLLFFAAWKKHIALYPAPTGSARFNKQLSRYRTEKSTVRFALDEPIPLDLITQIVKLRVKDNLRKAAARAKKRHDYAHDPHGNSAEPWGIGRVDRGARGAHRTRRIVP